MTGSGKFIQPIAMVMTGGWCRWHCFNHINGIWILDGDFFGGKSWKIHHAMGLFNGGFYMPCGAPVIPSEKAFLDSKKQLQILSQKVAVGYL